MIKQGYQIQIESWENDGDFYNTKFIDGLSKEQVKDYIQFLECIKPYGNESTRVKDFKNIFDSLVINKNSLIDPESKYPVDEVSDLIYETVGYNETGECVRVLESIKVYYIPVELNEVPISAFKE